MAVGMYFGMKKLAMLDGLLKRLIVVIHLKAVKVSGNRRNYYIEKSWENRCFPYIKVNGEKVQGHTKNAPHDGKAKPRHPSEYVELPFLVP